VRIVAGQDAASRILADGCDVIDATGWARRKSGVVEIGENIPLGDVAAFRNAIGHCKLLLGRIEHVKIFDATSRFSLFAAIQEVRNCDSEEDRDDRNHDHDLDERKSFTFACVQFSVPCYLP